VMPFAVEPAFDYDGKVFEFIHAQAL
jgi:hypothetical protein